MSTPLSSVIRTKAQELQANDDDAGELLNVLARIVEGRDPLKAFGAPGDWGYNTPIGAALYAELRRPQEKGGAS